MLELFNRYIIGATLPAALVAAGLYFWGALGFFPIAKFPRVAGALTRGGRGSLASLALSLAGTLGVGNIAGVAAAIFSGGFGAVFWMWVSALVASVLKYAEILLAMRHKVASEAGFKGGAPYYIRAVCRKKYPRAAALLPSIFAVLFIANCLSMGALMQTEAIAGAFAEACGMPSVLCGAVLAILTALLFAGGARGISRLATALVPFMSLVYVALSLAVIIPRAQRIPDLMREMISQAFSADSAACGVMGFLLSRAVRFGVMRGLFSNEAGCGTSPTAHASSGLNPCEQGFMGIAEVFIDTILLCSLTAFSLMLSFENATALGESPMGAVISAYSSAFAPPFDGVVRIVMAFLVLCFGFATISCLSHYASESLSFITKRRFAHRTLAAVYAFAVFLGAVIPPAPAWGISDLTVGCMTLINLWVLFVSRGEIIEETASYFKKSQNNCKIVKKFTKCS